MVLNGLGDLLRLAKVGRVDCNEDRLHAAVSTGSVGTSAGRLESRLRSIASMRRRCDQIRARMVSHVGRNPSRKMTRRSAGSLMSAWMSPHRLTVTSNQFL